MKKGAEVALKIGAGAIILGLALKLAEQVLIAMNYCWRIGGMTINSFTKNNISFTLKIRYLNKSSFQALLRSYNLDVYLNDKKIATINQSLNQKIEKLKVSIIEVPVSLNPQTKFTLSEIAVLLANYLTKAGQDKIKIRVAGTVSVKAYGIPINPKVDITMSVKEMLEVDPNAPICPENF